MKKSLFPLVALFGIVLTSCGTKTWTWEQAKSDGVLNYCLLIGQIDHNDSAARTAGIRDALGTRADKANQKTNANAEDPKQGTLTLNGTSYTTVELEHAEQKNTAGATWDQQTANATAQTWINKHGSDIDFFVSNNDGMAEGAIGASNWISGLPIFGYDSNASTLTLINEGKIMGTINQNASAQAAGIFMLTRNAIDQVSAPTEEGFSKASTNGYGKISSKYTYNSTNKSMLVDNFKITKDNVSSYLNKSASDLVDTAVTKGTTASKKVWMSYYSDQDNFLNSNMKPLFQLYKSTMNLEVTEVFGDGNDEKTELDKLTAASSGNAAYIINMTKTQNAKDYLDKIYAKDGDVPVIFWNRQATDADGAVDSAVMADSRFTKGIYYVGFDAVQGGQLQGQMIVDYLAGLN